MDVKAIIENYAQLLEVAVRQNKVDALFDWKRMFGGAAYYVDGQVFAAWYESEEILLKLSEEDGKALRALGGVEGPVQMSRLYTYVPLSIQNDEVAFAEWVAKSMNYVASQPKKKKK